MKNFRLPALFCVLSLALISGCGASNQAPASSSTTASAGGKIIVAAAASLDKAFTDIGE